MRDFGPGEWPQVRLLSEQNGPDEMLVERILNTIMVHFNKHNYGRRIFINISNILLVTDERNRVKKFILDGEMPGKERFRALEIPILKSHENDLLILRGLFTYNVLNHVLMKRWNVDFGIRDGGPGIKVEVNYRIVIII